MFQRLALTQSKAPVSSSFGRFTLRRLFVWVSLSCVLLACLSGLGRLVQQAQRAALSSAAQSPLNQLQLAFQNYHAVHGHFPPAYILGSDGQPWHSWRVLILPYLEEQATFDAYRFDEPWNGPHNGLLANQMPSIYGSPTEPPSRSCTNFAAITGPGTAFPGQDSTSLAEFRDGPENTLLLAEIGKSQLCWLEPRDLPVGKSVNKNDRPALTISAVAWRRPYVVFADRTTAYGLSPSIPPQTVHALATIAGGEPVTRAQLQADGMLK